MIGTATRDDAEALAAIHATCFTKAWSADEFAELFDAPGLIAVIDGSASGMALARVIADEAEILTIGVRPEARRDSIARQMMDEVMSRAHAAGADRLFLEVSKTNQAARTLYNRIGFAETGRRPRYYADGSDALILSKDLR